MDFETVGTVALVPRGLCGLSEMYFFYFAFILSLTRFVLGGTQQCLGLRLSRTRGNPSIVLNPAENGNSRGWLSGCVRWPLQAAGRRGVAAGAAVGQREYSEWQPAGGCGGLEESIWIEPDDHNPAKSDVAISLPRHPRPNFTESRVCTHRWRIVLEVYNAVLSPSGPRE